VLRAVLLRNMDIALSSSSDVEVFSLHARSQRYLRDRNLVFACCSLDSRGPDVRSPSSPGAESPIVVISDNPLADNFTVAIAMEVLAY
jgi:hypothetical protein